MGSESQSGESDIEIQSALPKISNKKMPTSPSTDLLKRKNDKKTTKEMINQALIELKTRKGVSLYAIKKYITEKYSVDTEKLNYHIKKYIKMAVEQGTIVQVKGVGASGSFKIVPVKEKKGKPKKMPKEKSDKPKNPEKKPKTMKEKVKKTKEKTTKTKSKVIKEGETEEKSEKAEKPKKKVTKDKKEKVLKEKKSAEEKVKKVRIAKGMQTPSKKKVAMMKRKSIGSIIKPPKMKPSKAKAVKS